MITFRLFPFFRHHSRSFFRLEERLLHKSFNSANEEPLRKSTKKFWSGGTRPNECIETESPYYFENGLRKVYPYYFNYTTYCKGRWINRSFTDVYLEEFGLYPKSDIEKRILSGKVLINGKVIGLDYKLKNSDFISSSVHRHELAVLGAPIKIIHEDKDFLIVDKPPSIPVHPCGLYRYNTVVFILQHEGKWKDLKTIHRLDRLTSGVLILTKNSKSSNKVQIEINERNVEKEYVCRVEGDFPEGVVVCDKPIRKVYSRMGVSLVCSEGKQCVTEFQKLSFNGKSSVVLCKPLTGRTHQIRVHLQYLGHPILNDPLYNSYAFGPDKGKNGVFHKSVNQLLDDLIKEHYSDWWLDSNPAKIDSELASALQASSLNWGIFEDSGSSKDQSRVTFDKHCLYCQKSYRDPNQTNLFQFLHAYKYKSKTWEFKTEMPIWALSNWSYV